MPREYLARASVIWTKLESYETPMDDVEANHHIAAGLSSLYEVETSILLAISSLSFAPMREGVQSAHDRRETKRREKESEYGGVAFMAAEPGRGHGARGGGGSRAQQRHPAGAGGGGK